MFYFDYSKNYNHLSILSIKFSGYFVESTTMEPRSKRARKNSETDTQKDQELFKKQDVVPEDGQAEPVTAPKTGRSSSGPGKKKEKKEPWKYIPQEEPKKEEDDKPMFVEGQSCNVIIQFKDQEDKDVGFEISVDSLTTSKQDLNRILKDIRQPEEGEDENQVFQFYLDDKEIKGSIQDILVRIHSSKAIDA